MWLHNEQEVTELPEDCVAFCYLITNLTNDRKYVGKKLATRSKIRMVNKKKKRTRVESDWRDYWGSNAELQEDVKRLGESNFRREILLFCQSRGQATYHEARLQFAFGVLTESGWYNSAIMCRIHKNHLKPAKKKKPVKTKSRPKV